MTVYMDIVKCIYVSDNIINTMVFGGRKFKDRKEEILEEYMMHSKSRKDLQMKSKEYLMK
jgi:hypothetical protein